MDEETRASLIAKERRYGKIVNGIIIYGVLVAFAGAMLLAGGIRVGARMDAKAERGRFVVTCREAPLPDLTIVVFKDTVTGVVYLQTRYGLCRLEASGSEQCRK